MLVDGSLAHSKKLRCLGLAEAAKEGVLHECLRDTVSSRESEMVDEQSSVRAALGEISMGGEVIAHAAPQNRHLLRRSAPYLGGWVSLVAQISDDMTSE